MSKQSRLKRAREKKRRRPPSGPDTGGPNKLMRRMSRDHLDVLHNIEFSLVSAYREEPGVDDAVVLTALQAALAGVRPEEPRAQAVFARLESIRELRTDVPPEVWRNGLRVVADSVRNHSTLRAGDVAYLKFVSPFLP